MRRNRAQLGVLAWWIVPVVIAVWPIVLFGQLVGPLVPVDSDSGSSPRLLPSLRLPGTTSSDLEDPLTECYQRGTRLEAERRWGEALAHYEEAIRRFPNEGELIRRFQLSRLHYEIGRRYHDASFLETVRGFSFAQALGACDEVLLKIQAHFVDRVRWEKLLQLGITGVEVALTEPAWWAQAAGKSDAVRLEGFRSELSRLSALQPATRQETCGAVAELAIAGERWLGVPRPIWVAEFACAVTHLLDIYSAYLTPHQLKEIYAQIEGNFVGLGIELRPQPGALIVVRVIPGSPAEAAGLRRGDRIVAVSGQTLAGLSPEHAADLLHGEEGSVAQLTVARPGEPQHEVLIRRRNVEVPSVEEYRLLDPLFGIAYLKLTAFQKNTTRELDHALWDLRRQGMQTLILDLRGNPGGLLVSAVESADRFIERGIIVSTRGRNSSEDFTYLAQPSGTWRVPLVVLVDEQSASAAEIFAGAIQDHRRGTLLGARTYGKGSVQGIFPLDSHPAGLRLTTSRFYSPTGRPYCTTGVEPDIVLHQAARPISASGEAVALEEDPVLAVAIQTARQLIAQR